MSSDRQRDGQNVRAYSHHMQLTTRINATLVPSASGSDESDEAVLNAGK